MNQTDTLLLRCAHTVKATGCVSMVRVHRALTALLEPLDRDDHAPVGDSLAAIARATICAAFDSLEDAIEEGGDEGKMEISEYFAAHDLITKLKLAALERFNALNNA